MQSVSAKPTIVHDRGLSLPTFVVSFDNHFPMFTKLFVANSQGSWTFLS